MEPRLELVSLIALIINSIILETGWIIEAWFHITNYSVSHQNVKASEQSSILYYCKISPSIGYYGKKCHHSHFFSGGSGRNGHCSKSHWVSIDWEHIHTYCRGSCLLSQQHQFWFEHGVINFLVWNYRNHTILIPFFCPRCTLLTTLYWMLLILNIINRVSQKKWLS